VSGRECFGGEMNNVEDRAKEIWQIAHEIIDCKRDVLGNFMRLGGLLMAAQDNSRYRSYGEHIRIFDHFLREMDIKKSTAYNAMAVKKEFFDVTKANRLSIEPTRLVRLLPLRLNEEEKPEWLMKAADLPHTAFMDCIRERQGKITTDACCHDEREAWERCKTCGKFFPAT